MQLGLYLSPALLLANTVCSDTHTLAQSPVIGSFALCRPSTPFPFFVDRALGSDKVHTDQLLSALPQTRMHSVCVFSENITAKSEGERGGDKNVCDKEAINN